MMRKILTSVAAIGIAGLSAYGAVQAANIPLFSSVSLSEPSQTLAAFNQLITNINTGVTGNNSYVPGPVGNAAATTSLNIVLASAIIPTGQLVAVNAGYRARCSGNKATTVTNANFGIVVGKSMSASIEQAVGTAPNWDVEIQWHAATSPVTANYSWMARGGASSATGNATNIVSFNSGNDTTLTDNNASFAIPVQCVLYSGAGGVATGLATMQNFIVEQLR